jgi:hypothetical protein
MYEKPHIKRILLSLSFMIIIFVLLIVFITFPKGSNVLNENNNIDTNNELDVYDEKTVFVEVATSQFCRNCHNWSKYMFEIYDSEEYDFEYVEMIVLDEKGKRLNNKAFEWDGNNKIVGYPTTIFDGGFKRLLGNHIDLFHMDINESINRGKHNIIAQINAKWLENATFTVNVSIQNNDSGIYNGYIRVYIVEIESRYNTYYGDPFHFGFLDFAIINNISLNPGEYFSVDAVWNGYDNKDNNGQVFDDILPENLKLILAVFNKDNNYSDGVATTLIK